MDGQAEILEGMLEQAYRAEKKRRKTEAKIQDMTGCGPSGIPRKFTARLARQERAVAYYRKRAEKILTRLPKGESVSEIFRLRFLGLYGWQSILEKTGITKDQCKAEYRRGFAILLEDNEVQELVARQAGTQRNRAQKQRPG